MAGERAGIRAAGAGFDQNSFSGYSTVRPRDERRPDTATTTTTTTTTTHRKSGAGETQTHRRAQRALQLCSRRFGDSATGDVSVRAAAASATPHAAAQADHVRSSPDVHTSATTSFSTATTITSTNRKATPALTMSEAYERERQNTDSLASLSAKVSQLRSVTIDIYDSARDHSTLDATSETFSGLTASLRGSARRLGATAAQGNPVAVAKLVGIVVAGGVGVWWVVSWII